MVTGEVDFKSVDLLVRIGLWRESVSFDVRSRVDFPVLLDSMRESECVAEGLRHVGCDPLGAIRLRLELRVRL